MKACLVFGLALLASACGARTALELQFDSANSSHSAGASGMSFAQPTGGSPSLAGGASGGSPQVASGGNANGAAGAAGAAGAPTQPALAKAIRAGTGTSCGLQENGTVWCWGANSNGQLGNGTTTLSSLPVQVLGIDSAIAIATGGNWNWGDAEGPYLSTFNCALLRGGSVQCWGRVPGQEGNHAVPVAVPGIDHAVAIAAGNWHACAVLEGGSVQCWGDNSRGQLGDGSMTGTGKPVTVLGISSATGIVGLGSDFSCAVLSSGSVQCWGDPFPGDSTPGSSIPVAIAISGVTPSSIAAGYHEACAVSPAGSVQCWSAVDMSTPLTVPGVYSAKAVAVGEDHACALLLDGTIQCWGNNSYGELGNTGTQPVTVSGIHDAVAVSAGYLYSCALLKAGSAWCWGLNDAGQLGNGADANDRLNPLTTPVEVRGF